MAPLFVVVALRLVVVLFILGKRAGNLFDLTGRQYGAWCVVCICRNLLCLLSLSILTLMVNLSMEAVDPLSEVAVLFIQMIRSGKLWRTLEHKSNGNQTHLPFLQSLVRHKQTLIHVPWPQKITG